MGGTAFDDRPRGGQGNPPAVRHQDYGAIGTDDPNLFANGACRARVYSTQISLLMRLTRFPRRVRLNHDVPPLRADHVADRDLGERKVLTTVALMAPDRIDRIQLRPMHRII